MKELVRYLSNKKLYILILLLILAGYFISTKKPSQIDTKVTKTNMNLSTYVNKLYYYQIQYPRDWRITPANMPHYKEATSDLSQEYYIDLLGSEVRITIGAAPNTENLSLEDYYNNLNSTRSVSPDYTPLPKTLTQTTFKGYKALKVLQTTQEGKNDFSISFYFTKTNLVFSIDIYPTSHNYLTPANIDQANAVIETFTFETEERQ